MNTGHKLQWLLGIAAGAAMLAFAAGCESQPRDAVVHGEDFIPDDAARSVREFVNMEAANSARADATLRLYHFDNGILNSLGEDRLDMILRNGDANNPLVIYLDLPADDPDNTRRQTAVNAYLKDRGLTDEQIEFKAGPNPNVNSFAAPLLAGQAAGPSGPSSASASAAPAPTGGSASSAH
ncbi:MAG TPA: hypothetical protein VG326_00570 [Tepidisphaeraceae bacterium]|jgi:hypothetical protein|nr:hypothetical protein [Tepidisphaeraceae bacterium]